MFNMEFEFLTLEQNYPYLKSKSTIFLSEAHAPSTDLVNFYPTYTTIFSKN